MHDRKFGTWNVGDLFFKEYKIDGDYAYHTNELGFLSDHLSSKSSREKSTPAIIHKNGSYVRMHDGLFHSANGPAILSVNENTHVGTGYNVVFNVGTPLDPRDVVPSGYYHSDLYSSTYIKNQTIDLEPFKDFDHIGKTYRISVTGENVNIKEYVEGMTTMDVVMHRYTGDKLGEAVAAANDLVRDVQEQISFNSDDDTIEEEIPVIGNPEDSLVNEPLVADQKSDPVISQEFWTEISNQFDLDSKEPAEYFKKIFEQSPSEGKELSSSPKLSADELKIKEFIASELKRPFSEDFFEGLEKRAFHLLGFPEHYLGDTRQTSPPKRADNVENKNMRKKNTDPLTDLKNKTLFDSYLFDSVPEESANESMKATKPFNAVYVMFGGMLIPKNIFDKGQILYRNRADKDSERVWVYEEDGVLSSPLSCLDSKTRYPAMITEQGDYAYFKRGHLCDVGGKAALTYGKKKYHCVYSKILPDIPPAQVQTIIDIFEKSGSVEFSLSSAAQDRRFSVVREDTGSVMITDLDFNVAKRLAPRSSKDIMEVLEALSPESLDYLASLSHPLNKHKAAVFFENYTKSGKGTSLDPEKIAKLGSASNNVKSLYSLDAPGASTIRAALEKALDSQREAVYGTGVAPPEDERSEDMARSFKIQKKTPKIAKSSSSAKEQLMKPNMELFEALTQEEVESMIATFDKIKDKAILPFEEEILSIAEKIMKEEGLTLEDIYPQMDKKPPTHRVLKDTKEKDVTKIIRAQPDLTGSKVSQVKNGFVFGFKKQLVNNSSAALAKKINAVTPFADNRWGDRLWQICLLLGLAEIFQKMPEGIASKIRMDEDARMDMAVHLRYLAGEQIGRDIVEIAQFVLPMVIEMVKDFSAEEIEEFSANLGEASSIDEALPLLEEAAEDSDLSSLFELVEEVEETVSA